MTLWIGISHKSGYQVNEEGRHRTVAQMLYLPDVLQQVKGALDNRSHINERISDGKQDVVLANHILPAGVLFSISYQASPTMYSSLLRPGSRRHPS
jgi:hypothetical protein